MKYLPRILAGLSLLLVSLHLFSQVKTIVRDGTSGIWHYEILDDTVTIEKPLRKSPAARAGLKRKDRIIAIGDSLISGQGLSKLAVNSLLFGKSGTELDLLVYRQKSDSLFRVSLIRDPFLSARQPVQFEYLVDSMHCYSLDHVLKYQDGFISATEAMVRIHDVEEGSPAENAGILSGDIFVSQLEESANATFRPVDSEYLHLWTSDTSLTVSREDSLLTLIVDPSKRKSLNGIKSQLSSDMESHCMWLRFDIEHRVNDYKDYLVGVLYFDNDTVTLFEESASGEWTGKRSGAYLPNDARDYVYKDWCLTTTRFSANETRTLYLRLASDQELYFPYVYIIPNESLRDYDRIERMIISLLGGMMLLIAFYYLIMFISSKNRNYLYYFLFIISFAILSLANTDYLAELNWKGGYVFTDKFYDLLFALPSLFFLLFGLTYLKIRSRYRWWFYITVVNLCLIGLTSSYLTIGHLLAKAGEYSDFYWVILDIDFISSGYLPFFILIVPAILNIRKGDLSSWFFLGANAILIGVFFLSDFSFNEFSDRSLYTSNLLKAFINTADTLAIVIQFFIFSIGLGQQMKGYEIARKKAQQRIIEQLRENEKLKDKVNRELEQKVAERTKEIQEQKEEIEAQRDEIGVQRDIVVAQKQELTDSINYAQRIQAAVLPHKSFLDEVMPEYFILYKPRDIVSGDFYWIREIRNYLVVVAADCTGHGVPGAFMSMLGIAMLNDIVGKSRFDRPGEILDRLRKKVKDTLTQEGKDHEQKDGMDMALAIIDRENLEVQFAGAFNPLYLIRDKRNLQPEEFVEYSVLDSKAHQLFEVKADRQPIAIHEVETEFTTRELQLKKGDTFYLFSDGFADQIGGPRAKKFLTRNFKKYLLEIQDFSMEEQHQMLDGTLEKWRTGYEQVDDILVLGIRV